MMKRHGLTQRALSEKLLSMGVSAKLDTIKSWFRKNPKNRHSPKLEAIRSMSEIFGVTIDDLVKKQLYDKQFVPTRVKNGKIDTNKSNLDNNYALNPKILWSNSSKTLPRKEDKAEQENSINLVKNNATEITNLSTTLPSRLQSQIAKHFLNLFSEFGNDALLLSVIEKLEKIKNISTK